MRLFVLAIPLLFTAFPVSAADPRPAGNMPVVTPGGSKKADCPRTIAHNAYRKGKPSAGQKLTDLPPANLYLSVYRKIDGCEVPIIAGYGIGASGEKRLPKR